ncbi:MAG: hypothetical protein ACRCTZ_22560 [Sarcina sp.]
MSIKSEQTKIKIKRKLSDIWYGLWKQIGKVLSNPYNYIYDKRINRLSDPNNYNHMKLLKIIEKDIARKLMRTDELHILDTRDTHRGDENDLELPYMFMEYSKSKYMQNYRRYAYNNDKYINWAEFIVKNLDVDYEIRNATEFFERYQYEYKKYEKNKVYVIRGKED